MDLFGTVRLTSGAAILLTLTTITLELVQMLLTLRFMKHGRSIKTLTISTLASSRFTTGHLKMVTRTSQSGVPLPALSAQEIPNSFKETKVLL